MLFATGVWTIGIAILTGGLAGGIVTGVIGPTLADRQGRYESYPTSNVAWASVPE